MLHRNSRAEEGGHADLFVAAHESVLGTFRTWRDVRHESAFGAKAEVRFRSRQVAFDPKATSLSKRADAAGDITMKKRHVR